MLLGADALGRLVLGQIPRNSLAGTAEGVILEIEVILIPGIAYSMPARISSGQVFGPPQKQKPVHAKAFGAVIDVGWKVVAGRATGQVVLPAEPFVPRLSGLGEVKSLPPVDARAEGDTATCRVMLISGRAYGGGGAPGSLIIINRGVKYDNDLLMVA
jgi:hypothetical protein